MKKSIIVILSLSLIFLFSREGSISSEITFAQPVKVVVSIHPLYDITKQIGRDKVVVKTLLPPAASPHTFEPMPNQMMEFSDAKAFIKIGAGLELWADKIVRAVSNKNLIVVDLSKNMPLIRETHKHKHEQHKRDSANASDPHFWLDPILAKKIVDRIADTLMQIDPANKNFYTSNAGQYKRELDKLHKEILAAASKFKTRQYVTFHPSWNYFSKRYGLRVLGVIEEAPGREPSPRDVARVINELKKSNVKVVFAEPQFNPKIAEAIAKEAGAKVLFLDPIGAPNAPDRDTYIKLMRYNLYQMERAMR